MVNSTIQFRPLLSICEGRNDFEAILPSKIESNNGDHIEGIIDGFPFRAPVIQTQDGPAIQLTQAILKAINAQPGDEVSMEITRIGDEPEVRMPKDWSRAVHSSPNAAELWHEITPMARREWIRWIASARQEKTRQSRIEAGIDMLEKGKRRPCCFPGINWVTKDLVSPEETWTALPKS